MAIHVTDLHTVRDQLLARREKLETATARSQTANLLQLMEQVDRALEKLDAGSFGVCERCHGTVEQERLLADPLASVCLDCLPPHEARALEADLQLAAQIQAGLLPRQEFSAAGWNGSFHYEAAGLVSGDYCDLMAHGQQLYFMLGDVSGKGIAASMLMANLHAMFRALVPTGLPLQQLVESANRIFCESTLPTQYATLVCGRANQGGEVEICNGGHLAPLHVNSRGVTAIDSATLPVGLFHDQQFATTHLQFSPEDSLVLYTDGVTESHGRDGSEYGVHRLSQLLENGRRSRGPCELVRECIDDVKAFRAGSPRLDDQTLMVLQFAPAQN
jgi:sigma-B regulation protein RsbU (phosphoserine phosphatase)